MKLPKVTPRQRYVLERMNSGLALSANEFDGAWLDADMPMQPAEKISLPTFRGLLKKGLMVSNVRRGAFGRFWLTDLGRAVLGENDVNKS